MSDFTNNIDNSSSDNSSDNSSYSSDNSNNNTSSDDNHSNHSSNNSGNTSIDDDNTTVSTEDEDSVIFAIAELPAVTYHEIRTNLIDELLINATARISSKKFVLLDSCKENYYNCYISALQTTDGNNFDILKKTAEILFSQININNNYECLELITNLLLFINDEDLPFREYHNDFLQYLKICIANELERVRQRHAVENSQQLRSIVRQVLTTEEFNKITTTTFSNLFKKNINLLKNNNNDNNNNDIKLETNNNDIITNNNVIDNNDEQESKILKFEDIKTIYVEENETCSICRNDFEESDDNIKVLHCEHLFHCDCIKQWLTTQSYKCPICRKESSSDYVNVDSES